VWTPESVWMSRRDDSLRYWDSNFDPSVIQPVASHYTSHNKVKCTRKKGKVIAVPNHTIKTCGGMVIFCLATISSVTLSSSGMTGVPHSQTQLTTAQA
jgi:hypothetical protein